MMNMLSGECSQQKLRQVDIFGRYGGEEFAGVLPESSLDKALMVSQRIQQDVACLTLGENSQPVQCTVSIGVAGLESPADTLEHLLARADQALLTAKRTGRNRVELLRLGDT